MTARVSNVAEPDRFQDLLDDLQAEHERALASLRDERRSVMGEEHQREVSMLRAEISRLQTEKQQGEQQDSRRTSSTGRGSLMAIMASLSSERTSRGDAAPAATTSPASTRKPEAPVARTATRSTRVANAVVLNDSIASLRSAWRTDAMHTLRRESSLEDLDSLGYSPGGRRVSRLRSRRSRSGQQPETSLRCGGGGGLASVAAPISPASEGLLYWDLLGVAFICYDMFAIPLLVYDPPQNWLSTATDWLILLFWTASILVTFNSGFYDKGKIVMSRQRIVSHYVTGWLLLDLLVVVPDWVLGFIDTTNQHGEASRLLRTGRVVRVLRLLRVMKLQRVITKLYDKIDSEYMFIMADMCKMICFILAMCHLIACGWFLVGKFADDLNETTWISWSEDFWDTSMGYQYATSLHWTLTQFTPASMDVVARNLLERIYSILVLLLAMTTFSSFVGTVTSSITSLRNMRGDKQKSFWLLRRYLKQNKISFDLSSRMNRFIEHQLNDQAKVVLRSNVKILAYISEGMAQELAYEQYAPCLYDHAFFHHLSRSMMVVASRICHTALKSQHLAMGDIVFQAGEEAQACCILKRGQLDYIRVDGVILEPPPDEREWMAEASLWTQWWFCGSCFATRMSEVIWVLGDKFTEVMAIHPRPWALAQVYGEKFIHYLNRQGPANWLDVLRDDSFYEGAVGEAVEDAAIHSASEASEGEERDAPARAPTEAEAAANLDHTMRHCAI